MFDHDFPSRFVLIKIPFKYVSLCLNNGPLAMILTSIHCLFLFLLDLTVYSILSRTHQSVPFSQVLGVEAFILMAVNHLLGSSVCLLFDIFDLFLEFNLCNPLGIQYCVPSDHIVYCPQIVEEIPEFNQDFKATPTHRRTKHEQNCLILTNFAQSFRLFYS